MKKLNIPNITSDLIEKGYAFLPELLPYNSTYEIAEKVGILVKDKSISGVHKLVPKRKEESNPNLYSGNFGLGDFPYHTDMAHWFKPPHYLMLRCIKGSDIVFTKILHSKKVFEQLTSNTINRALFKPRRKIKGRLSLLRFKELLNKSYLVRWDQLFLTPSNNEAKTVSECLLKMKSSQSEKVLLNIPGDTLIIDNYKTFHGRTNVPQSSPDRIIERIYLEKLYYDN